MKGQNNGGPTSQAGFTPGPWHVFDPGPHDLMQVRGEPDEGTDGPKVCDINDIGGYLGDYEANARLIAAAPELYEALEQLALRCDTTALEDGSSIDTLRAHVVLAKARGETFELAERDQ